MPVTLLVALALLVAATAAAQVHVQGTLGDIELLSERQTENAAPVNYTGHKVLRVIVGDNGTADVLRKYMDSPGVNFWSETNEMNDMVDVMVSPDVKQQLTDQLTDSGASYTVNIHDVQDAIAAENPESAKEFKERLNLRHNYPIAWNCYHRLADHHQYLDYIAHHFRGLCDTFSIGTSTEGRDLKGVKCGLGKREVWIDGGIHAREWISPAVVSYLASEFSENSYESRDILKEFTVYIVPILNPDGYEYTHTSDRMWRKTRSKTSKSNCIGVDANRNFDVLWGEHGTSSNPCHETYGGPEPFSEPETRAVRDFVLSHNNTLEMFITFHSYAELLYVPYAFTERRPSDYSQVRRVAEEGVQAAQRVNGKQFNIPPTTKQTRLSGVSDDWAKAKAGIKYTYTFELRDTGRYGFLLPADQIEPSGREMTAAVQAMIRAIL